MHKKTFLLLKINLNFNNKIINQSINKNNNKNLPLKIIIINYKNTKTKLKKYQ